MRHWLRQCRVMIAATGPELPHIGRPLTDAGRLAGPARAADGPADLLVAFQRETRAAAAAIRALTPAERARQGIDGRGQTVTVGDAVGNFIVAHAEEHCGQLEQAFRGGA